ncbi:Hypothetical predicted protein [Olea europaea subsp. europaea]|uniref:Uncharacterized protein n=1 Tax=Olea europaea subsp. europaea TaxID=158383 RepID=A0A8S0U2Q7_OLEEU|nr:Hypothetical predicted protein [Olea europaea subsp. europaea]
MSKVDKKWAGPKISTVICNLQNSGALFYYRNPPHFLSLKYLHWQLDKALAIPSQVTTMFTISTTFLPTRHHLLLTNPPKLSSPKSLSISALILPPSSSSPPQRQQLYQPFRPPPSPVPAKYRSLDTNARMEILINRMGLWYEYGPLIPSLTQEGFTPATLEEITGIPSAEQNRLIVAAQVRESLVQSTDPDTVAYFDPPGFSELLYEIRLLNNQQRTTAARFIIANKFDGKQTQELAKAMKDFPRRYGDRGWDSFNGKLPGDCLGFMYFRQAQEHKTASSPELSKAALERALEVVESDKAKKRVEEELERKDGRGASDMDSDDVVRVPLVRMAVGEVAESSVVAILPVCKAEEREIEVEAAPWECGMEGEFGVLAAEKGWTRWVVLPGWEPVATLKRGGVAVLFPKAKGILPYKSKRKEVEEEILVVADRGTTEVSEDDGFYLVVSGGNGIGVEGLKVEKGSKLKESGVTESLGTVVLVVRPPREEYEDQLADEDWE